MRPKPEKMNTTCTKFHKISQTALKYSKWQKNISIFYYLNPSKIYPNLDSWFENKPSGNPANETISPKKLGLDKKVSECNLSTSKFGPFSPKWRNLSQSGHTSRLLQMMEHMVLAGNISHLCKSI
jgi:hypothetical protein